MDTESLRFRILQLLALEKCGEKCGLNSSIFSNSGKIWKKLANFVHRSKIMFSPQKLLARPVDSKAFTTFEANITKHFVIICILTNEIVRVFCEFYFLNHDIWSNLTNFWNFTSKKKYFPHKIFLRLTWSRSSHITLQNNLAWICSWSENC